MAIDREKVVQSALKFAEKKRYGQAIAEYQKILQEDPNDPRILLKIGDLQLKGEFYQAAIETYEKVGKHYAQSGFATKAIAVYKQIRDLIGKHAPQLEEKYSHILPKLADLYGQLGLVSDALTAYDEVATKFLRAGRDAEAVEAFEKLVSLDPSNPLPHLRLAEALARSKDVDGSITQFSTAADMLMQLGRRDDALKVFDRLLQIRQDPAIAKRAATVLLERNSPGDGMTALKYLQISFQSNPKELETLELLARAFEALGQAPKAIEVQKETARVARDQNNHEVMTRVLGHLMRVAPHDETVQALARAAGLGQPQPPPRPQPVVRPTAPVITTSESDFDDFDEPLSSGAIIEVQEDGDLVDDGEFLDEDDGMAVRDPHARSSHSGPVSVGVVSVPASLRIAEDGGGSNSDDIDPDAFTQETLTDVLGFRRARQPARAIECLRIALEVLPGSVVLREQLRDVLLETGDRNGAVGELITLATLAMEQGDEEQAQNLLGEVLLLVPGHERAREMLATLSFGGLEPIADDHGEGDLLFGDDNGIEIVDPSAPLASYDLEEVGADEALSHRSSPPAPLELDADDPFDAPPQIPVRLAAQGPGPVRPYVPPAPQPVRPAATPAPRPQTLSASRQAPAPVAPAPVAAPARPSVPTAAAVPRPAPVGPPRPSAPSAPALAPPRPGPPRPSVVSVPAIAPAPGAARPTAASPVATPAPRAPVPPARPMMVTPVAPPVADPVFEIDEDPFLTADSEAYPSAHISPTAPAGYAEPELDEPVFTDDSTPAFSPAEYDPARFEHQGSSSFDQLDAPDDLEPIDDLDRASPNPFEDTVEPGLALDEPTGPPVLAASIKAFQGGDSIEDAMEEVDFFASRGLFEDARAILEEQLARSPKNRLLLDRLDELNEAEAAAQPAGGEAADDFSGASTASQEPLPVSTHAGQQAFDEDLLDASLDALDAFEPTQEAQHHFQQDDEQVDVEAVFAKFKEGVKKQVDDSDSATHYDLGVAYKEMGLLPDAIHEFEMAARDPARACVCHSMVAMIEIERNKPDAAIRAFQRALAAEHRTPDQEVSLWYELGVLFEGKRSNAEALGYFRKAQARDPNYRDVAEKIRQLEPPAPKKPGRQINNDEDFDLVFDDILGGSKP